MNKVSVTRQISLHRQSTCDDRSEPIRVSVWCVNDQLGKARKVVDYDTVNRLLETYDGLVTDLTFEEFANKVLHEIPYCVQVDISANNGDYKVSAYKKSKIK